MNLFILHPIVDRASNLVSEEIEVWDNLGIQHGANIAEIPANSLVVPRFRMLPFARELEQEIATLGSKLVNSYREHRAIANLFNWVHLLEGLTPPAYGVDFIPYLPEGEYFVKGETNSKKSSWFEHAFAPSKRELTQVVRNLQLDSYVGSQQLAIRPFQSYRKISTAVTGQPIFHERRAFYFQGKLLSEGHYWSPLDYGAPEPRYPEKYSQTQEETVARVGDLAPFLVIDYAEYSDGGWGVVELNDGSMSGLSNNDPLTLWSNFKAIVKNS